MKRSFKYLTAFGLLAAALGVSFVSCTKTVTETVQLPAVHDTTRGPALLRFISMLPDGKQIYIKHTADVNTPVWMTALPYSQNTYAIEPHDSAQIYYLFKHIDTCYDSIAVPVLAANSIHTCCIFLDSTVTRFSLADDSAKLHPAPAGQCYVRFVNGISQFPPSAPTLYLDLDNIGQTPFMSEGQPAPVQYRAMNNYTLIPAGQHKVIVRYGQDSDQQELKSMYQSFEAGNYYTVRAYGQYPPTMYIGIDSD